MGKSIRSKRMKHLRTLKRHKLEPVDAARISVRSAKLHKIIRDEIPATVDVEPVEEEKNPSKERPYKFNFLAAKLHHEREVKNGKISEPVKVEESDESDAEMEVEEAAPARRGRDRTVKVSNATSVLRELAAKREATGNLLPPDHDKRLHQNVNKSTAPGTTTNGAQQKKVVKNVLKVTRTGNPHHRLKEEDQEREEIKDFSVSYVELGEPTKVRRGKSAQEKRSRSKSKGRSAIVQNWHKIG